ncbi:hypothetical protein WAB17_13765 [Parerythrobacter aurantius]|uniref:hypothetical protein n=1 Tax=Parerythrobacter aurantius TaxID=3127706 RepID=UPI003247D094
MSHLWFIPNPSGPFAGHNHWLPFIAVGLPTPSPDKSREVGPAVLAVAEALPASLLVERGYTVLSSEGKLKVDGLRQDIAALAVTYRSALDGGNASVAQNALAEIAQRWRSIRSVHSRYLPERQSALLDIAYANIISGEAHHAR